MKKILSVLISVVLVLGMLSSCKAAPVNLEDAVREEQIVEQMDGSDDLPLYSELKNDKKYLEIYRCNDTDLYREQIAETYGYQHRPQIGETVIRQKDHGSH